MTIIDEWCQQIARELDDKVFQFLADNGYKVEKPYTIEKAVAIKNQLAQEGKKLTYELVVDKIEFNNITNKYEVIYKTKFSIEDIKEG